MAAEMAARWRQVARRYSVTMKASPRLSHRYKKAARRLWHKFCSRIYQDRFPDLGRTILVAGTARSGTTWLAEIIASQTAGRIVFEPFNPGRIHAYQGFNYHQYLRPGADNKTLESYCRQVFSGKFRHPWLDREVNRILPNHRVVKAVRANLLLGWLDVNFPEVPKILLLRHPCAVFFSWNRLGWNVDGDIQALLEQPQLISDYLGGKRMAFYQTASEAEKFALLWCIQTMVPLSQGGKGKLRVVFYEHLVAEPELELPKLFRALGYPYQVRHNRKVRNPSMTANYHNGQNPEHYLSAWRDLLPTQQIDQILAVVASFGLDQLYHDGSMPVDRKVPDNLTVGLSGS